MKTKDIFNIVIVLCLVAIIGYGVRIGVYNNVIHKLKKENEILKNDKEYLATQLINKQECDCGWYEDFYYEHASEVGANE